MWRKSIKVSFPLIFLKTQRGLGILDRLARLSIIKSLSWLWLFIIPALAGICIFFLFDSISIYLVSSAAREATRAVGPAGYLLLPGLNPYIPAVHGWLAFWITLLIHEGAHGVIARSKGLKVDSVGIILFLGIPIGAFCEIDEQELQKTKTRDFMRVLAAGPGSNATLAAAALLGMLLIVNAMTPVVAGVGVMGIFQDSPADQAGVMPGDIITAVNGAEVYNLTDISEKLQAVHPGDEVGLTIYRSGKIFNLTVRTAADPENASRARMGVYIKDIASVPSNYVNWASGHPRFLLLTPYFDRDGIIPFSGLMSGFYSAPILGSFAGSAAHLLFWFWLINFWVAIFNALPIYPMDGGQIFNRLLKKILPGHDEKKIKVLTRIVTLAMVSLLAISMVLPYLL